MTQRIPSFLAPFLAPDGAAGFEVRNPATGAALARVPDQGPEEARKAVQAAQTAFRSWSALLPADRAAVLRRWHDGIQARREELAALLTQEQGKPLAEARGEIAYAASFVALYAGEAERVAGEVLPVFRPDARGVVLRQPLGVVAAITPWNFPSAMVTRKVAPALAAGCAVVCKPAEQTPLSALALAALAQEAGMPPGVLNILTTSRPEPLGAALMACPDLRVVSFTGSTEVGKLLMRQAADTVKKVALELGGNAAFIVFDDADIEAAAQGAVQSKFRNMGQTCVCANRIFVQRGVYDAFARRFAEIVAGLRVGDGMEEGVAQGPLVDEAALRKVEEHIGDAVRGGAKILCGGKRHALGRTFFEPTVLAQVAPDARILEEETFGPVAPLIPFLDEAGAVALANATERGLGAYFYTRDVGRVWRVAEALEAGVIGVNTGNASSAIAPFGGIKESGFGREGGTRGLEEFQNVKYVLMAGLG